MKRFPNQVSQIGRLIEVLRLFDSLGKSGVDLADDLAVGDAAARAVRPHKARETIAYVGLSERLARRSGASGCRSR
jgi:hypothetical protein